MKKSIREQLVINLTISNSSKSKLNEDTTNEYSDFLFREKLAYEALYKYAVARVSTSRNGENAVVDSTIVTRAMNSIQDILDMIGEVNGHAIVKNQSMLDILANTAIVSKKVLAGDALTKASEVANYRKQLNNVTNGTSEDYINDIEGKLEVAEEELAELKKHADSANVVITRVSLNSFRVAFERELGLIITKQEARTWEDIEAESEKRKAERRAKAKAKRAEKRQNEAKAKANA